MIGQAGRWEWLCFVLLACVVRVEHGDQFGSPPLHTAIRLGFMDSAMTLIRGGRGVGLADVVCALCFGSRSCA